MSLVIKQLYEFEEFRLDTEEKILWRGDEHLELTPKAFELLTLFVENHGRLLKKEEIMEKIWAESFVEESNLTFNIGQLRKVLGDDAQQPKFIKTIRQHGYRFIADVKSITKEKLSVKTVENPPPKPIEDVHNLISKDVQESFSKHISKPYFVGIGLAILLILILSGALILNGNFISRKPNVPILNTAFKSERLTNTGGVYHAVISPDGKRMAYSSENGGKQGLWIRQFESFENIQIISNSNDFYGGLGFSHDGETLFFTSVKDNQPQTIYRISAMGGIPKEIVSKTQGWFSLSPDDKQISFVRCPQQEEDYCSLYVADSDGKNERKILTRPRPFRISDNHFSPDGKSIAAAIGQSRNGSQEFSLIDVDVATGKEREITNQKFFNIQYFEWLPDKSGFLMSAVDRFFRPDRIYQVSNDTGEAKALTNDSNNYNRLSLDSNFQKMVVTQFIADFRLWVAPVDDIKSAKPISYANATCSFTQSGKLVYASLSDGNFNIWTINPDGSNQRQLTNNQSANFAPRVSADERYIFFTSNLSGSKQVWRMNIDGTNQMQISQGEGGTPFFASSDGNTVFYETALNSNLGKILIQKDGNIVSDIISKERIISPEINPSEDTVAYFSRKPDENVEMVLMALPDGKILKTFNLNKLREFRLQWAKDGKSIFYLSRNGLNIVILQLFLETGETKKFIEFNSDDIIDDFHFSPDGKNIAFIQGKWRHDVYLIEGLK